MDSYIIKKNNFGEIIKLTGNIAIFNLLQQINLEKNCNCNQFYKNFNF